MVVTKLFTTAPAHRAFPASIRTGKQFLFKGKRRRYLTCRHCMLQPSG